MKRTGIARRRYLLFIIAGLVILAFGKISAPYIVSFIDSQIRPGTGPRLEENVNALHPSGNKYLFPRYQDKWLEIKANFKLTDQEMIEIFRRIKDVERYRYGPGQLLNDLSIYPEIVERALNILVLRNIRSSNGLSQLVSELRTRFTYSRAFPDEKEEYVGMLDSRQFGNMCILVFYEDVLQKEPIFAQELIAALHGRGRSLKPESSHNPPVKSKRNA